MNTLTFWAGRRERPPASKVQTLLFSEQLGYNAATHSIDNLGCLHGFVEPASQNAESAYALST